MQAAPGPPEPVVIYRDRRTRVTRRFLPDGPVVCKEPLGPGAEERLRHEQAVLERLAGVPGVIQLAEPACDGKLTLEDVEGIPLAEIPALASVDQLLRLGLELARTVAAMHGRGVVHRSLNPSNILVLEPRRTPILIDFGQATTFAEVRPEFTHPTEILGALPYLAPEQTGRTGRPVDQRADLYALGAILYEQATGVTPFDATDPMQLSRQHLTRTPVPPGQLRATLPEPLSAIIMHLLATEPDERYQTAEGLAHDLARLGGDWPAELGAPFEVGAQDFPVRLRAPSRLVGRDREIGTLADALAGASSGRCRAVMIGGVAGVGKSSLIDELRPRVTASNGWFLAGKFDQFRRDQEYDAVRQAFRGLARLLLAEPEPDLAAVRARLLASLGDNADLLATVVPEFAAVLDHAPRAPSSDPFTAGARLQRTGVEALRVIASPKRPVVLVVDDLQWATDTPLGFVDMVVNDDDLDGLLLVGAYRDEEVDATHPLAALLERWQQAPGAVEHLHLHNLPPPDLAGLLGDTLRLHPDRATALADQIGPYTGGNPYETVELLNALRLRGILTTAESGWQWQPQRLREYLAQVDTTTLLAEQSAALPPPTQTLLQVMSCLGGGVTRELLATSVDQSIAAVDATLSPAIEAGLLVLEPGEQEAVRFRHDQVREAVRDGLAAPERQALRLRLARRLARHPELFAVAADEYLPVLDQVREPQERARVVVLLRRAAEQAKMMSNHQMVERLLGGAAGLLTEDARHLRQAQDRPQSQDPELVEDLREVLTGRHTALVSLGRLPEADTVFDEIAALSAGPLDRIRATMMQLSSLTSRSRPHEAIALGGALLRELDCPLPPPDQLGAEVERQRADLRESLAAVDGPADERPDLTDPRLLAVGSLLNRMMPPAYFSDLLTVAWLSLQAWRIWLQHGPSPALVGPMSHLGYLAMGQGDYRDGPATAERVLAMSEARGYEPATSDARWVRAMCSCWAAPLEVSIALARDARERLIHAGDLQAASYTYHVTVHDGFDCASLDDHLAEAEAAIAFTVRMGNDQSADTLFGARQLALMLRGDPGGRAGFAPSESLPHNPAGRTGAHVGQAMVAAIFGDTEALSRHTAAAMPSLGSLVGSYVTSTAHLLRALALAEELRHAAGPDRAPLLAELDRVVAWVAARAADAPDNFRHLLHLAEAERAWAVGDFRAAASAFDAAQRDVEQRTRPWHRALILERGAKFCLAHGMDHLGRLLLAQARQAYADWGAAAKVDQLDWAYPVLRATDPGTTGRGLPGPPASRSTLMTRTIDLLGILAASQALSSETSVEGVRARVGEVLGSMTGATAVHLVLWDEDDQRWLTGSASDPVATGSGSAEADAADAGSANAETANAETAEAVEARLEGEGQLPVAVLRYVERTREPLLVNDVVTDDRFAREPYFSGVERCSLLATPVLSRGRLRAVLVLENRLLRGAFASDRLDGVMMIAGQLAVSLDNALTYASLERRVAERTEDLAQANKRLAALSITDALTGLANRRRLEEVLSAEWLRSQRSGAPVSVAMVDIDRFKAYNDHYGHAAGDRCLQQVASLLRDHVRDADLVARYGGEEFAVVMPGTGLGAAVEVAERLRAKVAAAAEPHPPSPDERVTVSIGVAAMAYAPQTMVEHLLEQADTELYRAKRGGRNQVRPAKDRRPREPSTRR